MKITQIMGGIEDPKTIIELQSSDFVMGTGSPHVQFWRKMDEVAKHFGVPPFCPCGERPHRIHCPLGVDNYFPLKSMMRAQEKPDGN